MKIKRAFTLAEVLIALGIVGVIAAVMLPMANKMQPDKDKVSYLRAYDSLVHTMRSLVRNETVYGQTYINKDDVKIDISGCPLVNDKAAEKGPFAGIGTKSTYVYAGEKLKSILQKVYDGKNFASQPIAGQTWNFESKGMYWRVDPYSKDPFETGEFYNVVYVDINGKENPNKMVFDSSKPKVRPDQFKFYITANGNVIPADSVGRYYVERRSFWKKTKLNTSDLPNAIDIAKVKDREIIFEEKTEGSAVPPIDPVTPPSDPVTPPSDPVTPPSKPVTPPSKPTPIIVPEPEPVIPPSNPVTPPSNPVTPPSNPVTPPSITPPSGGGGSITPPSGGSDNDSSDSNSSDGGSVTPPSGGGGSITPPSGGNDNDSSDSNSSDGGSVTPPSGGGTITPPSSGGGSVSPGGGGDFDGQSCEDLISTGDGHNCNTDWYGNKF